MCGAVILAFTLANVAGASAAQPIEGRWKDNDEGTRVIEYYATGPNKFTTREVGEDKGTCGGRVDRITGSGLSYKGTRRFYNASTCEVLGDGNIEITVAADRRSFRIEGAPPSPYCCAFDYRVQRASDPAYDAMPPGLAATVNGYLLEFQKLYQRWRKGDKETRAKVYKTVRARGSQRLDELEAYKPTDSDEFRLKNCAKEALGKLKTATKGTSKFVDGIHGLKNCLKPYRRLFPNGKPGSTPKKGPPAKPADKPHRWNGWGTKGDAAYTFPRISFNVTDSDDGTAVISGLDFAVRIICFNGGGGMLTNKLLPGMAAARIPVDSKRSFDYTYGDARDRFSFTIRGNFDKSFKSVTGTLTIFGRDCKNFYESWAAWPAP